MPEPGCRRQDARDADLRESPYAEIDTLQIPLMELRTRSWRGQHHGPDLIYTELDTAARQREPVSRWSHVFPILGRPWSRSLHLRYMIYHLWNNRL